MDKGIAEEWIRDERVPESNSNVGEGIKYFHICHFAFEEDDNKYSQLPGAIGFASLPSQLEETWFTLLTVWEDEVVRNFQEWNRRADMDVYSHAWRKSFKDGKVSREPLSQDIIRPFTSADRVGSLETSSLPANYYQYIRSSPEAEKPRHRVGFDSYCKREALYTPGLRVQSVVLVRAITAQVTHELVREVHLHHYVPNARLVLWIETTRQGKELAWRFLGAVYSWKHCRMEPLSNCSEATLSTIATLTQPLVRRWAQLIRLAEKKTLQSPPVITVPLTPLQLVAKIIRDEEYEKTPAGLSRMLHEHFRSDFYNRSESELMCADIVKTLGKLGPKAVPALVSLLQDADANVRAEIVQALKAIGSAAAVPALILLLRNTDALVRANAAYALGVFGSVASEAVLALVPLLQDQVAEVRECAAQTLGEIDSAAAEAVPALVPLLRDQEAEVRARAVYVLGRIGSDAAVAVPALIPLLQDQVANVRKCAAQTLGEIGSAAAVAVPALIPLLQDAEPRVRVEIVQALQKMGSDALTALPALVSAFRESGEDIIGAIGNVLTNFSSEAVPALVPLLRDQEAEVRARAVYVLGRIGSDAAVAVPALIPLLQDQVAEVRECAAQTLGEIDSAAAEAVPALVPLLRDQEAEVRARVAYVLGRIGSAAAVAVPALIPLLQDSEPRVRLHVVEALEKMGSDALAALPALVSAFRESSRYNKSNLCIAISNVLRNFSSEAVPALIPLLQDQEANVRAGAAYALGRIGSDAAVAVPALIPLLQDQVANVRKFTAQALGEIGSDAAVAVPALIPLLQDHNAMVRIEVARCLERLGSDTAVAVPALVPLLQDQVANVRKCAAQTLGEIGSAAAVPALVPLLQDADADVRLHVVETLEKMGSDALAALPALMVSKNDEARLVRSRAAEAVKTIAQEYDKMKRHLDSTLETRQEEQSQTTSITNNMDDTSKSEDEQPKPKQPNATLQKVISRLEPVLGGKGYVGLTRLGAVLGGLVCVGIVARTIRTLGLPLLVGSPTAEHEGGVSILGIIFETVIGVSWGRQAWHSGVRRNIVSGLGAFMASALNFIVVYWIVFHTPISPFTHEVAASLYDYIMVACFLVSLVVGLYTWNLLDDKYNSFFPRRNKAE